MALCCLKFEADTLNPVTTHKRNHFVSPIVSAAELSEITVLANTLRANTLMLRLLFGPAMACMWSVFLSECADVNVSGIKVWCVCVCTAGPEQCYTSPRSPQFTAGVCSLQQSALHPVWLRLTNDTSLYRLSVSLSLEMIRFFQNFFLPPFLSFLLTF